MTRLDKVFASVGFAMACVPWAMATLVMPGFRETFEAFGSDLPWLTRTIADHPATLLLMPACVLLLALAWPRKNRRGFAALLMGSLCFVLGPLLILVATYLPIWTLGAAL
jgi:type II secretory pathway component PulF